MPNVAAKCLVLTHILHAINPTDIWYNGTQFHASVGGVEMILEIGRLDNFHLFFLEFNPMRHRIHSFMQCSILFHSSEHWLLPLYTAYYHKCDCMEFASLVSFIFFFFFPTIKCVGKRKIFVIVSIYSKNVICYRPIRFQTKLSNGFFLSIFSFCFDCFHLLLGCRSNPFGWIVVASACTFLNLVIRYPPFIHYIHTHTYIHTHACTHSHRNSWNRSAFSFKFDGLSGLLDGYSPFCQAHTL